jgi:hypothetical protein
LLQEEESSGSLFFTGTGGSSFGGSEKSYASSETHEFLMLLRCLMASTSLGAVGSVT